MADGGNKNEYSIGNDLGDGGQLSYRILDNSVEIIRYRGTGSNVTVPSFIDGKRVVSIDKKAFLSCKSIRRISLPSTIERIGDWAFAHAEGLEVLELPQKEISCGKEIFLGCKSLRSICLRETDCADPDSEDMYAKNRYVHDMLAAAVTIFRDYFLFDLNEAGNEAWLRRWDMDLIKLIGLDDLDGFDELGICGEEDYEGKDYDIKSYPQKMRRMKVRLVYFRLLNPHGMEADTEETLKAYLKEHTLGTDTPEGFEVLIGEHRQELEYYKIFCDAGCAGNENFDMILSEMEGVNPEIKAYMLKYRDENLRSGADAFSSLTLDW